MYIETLKIPTARILKHLSIIYRKSKKSGYVFIGVTWTAPPTGYHLHCGQFHTILKIRDIQYIEACYNDSVIRYSIAFESKDGDSPFANIYINLQKLRLEDLEEFWE